MWCMFRRSRCIALGEAQQRSPEQRPARQVERPRRLLRACRRGLLLPPAGRQARRSTTGSGSGSGPDGSGGRPAAARRRRGERGAQRLVAADDLVEARAPGRSTSSRPRDPERRPGRCRPTAPAAAGRGTRAAPGRTRAAPALRPGAGAGAMRRSLGCAVLARAASILSASAATVGASNRARSGSSTPRASRMRETSLGGQQRVPAQVEEVVVRRRPRRPSSSAQTAASCSSVAVRGATRRLRVGGGLGRVRARARRSTLPFGVSGSASRRTNADGHHVVAAACARRASRSARPPDPSAVHVGHQPLVAVRRRGRGPRPRARRGGAAGPPRSRRARCGSRGSSPVVDAAQELELARPAASAPGRPCGRGAPRSATERVGHEPLGGQVGPVQVAAGQAGAADAQLARRRRPARAARRRRARRRARPSSGRPIDGAARPALDHVAPC